LLALDERAMKTALRGLFILCMPQEGEELENTSVRGSAVFELSQGNHLVLTIRHRSSAKIRRVRRNNQVMGEASRVHTFVMLFLAKLGR
jgi:hypothetical protein